MEIEIGYVLAKPVETQAQCDAYTAMVEAVNAHNAACAVGDTLWSIADKPGCYEVTDGGVKPDPENTLRIQKEKKVSESKTILATYLENHPLQWTDGKYYSVTSEKQSLLTSNLALYQISVATAQPFKLTWNSTGDECVEQTYENLAALALGIGVYVKPFVSHQQELELRIKECNTLEQLNVIKIEYDSVTQVVKS